MDTEQAVEKVREALTWLTIAPTSPAVDALAALDFLVSGLEEAERKQAIDEQQIVDGWDDALKAIARAEAAERERDEWAVSREYWKARAEAAENRAERIEARWRELDHE